MEIQKNTDRKAYLEINWKFLELPVFENISTISHVFRSNKIYRTKLLGNTEILKKAIRRAFETENLFSKKFIELN